MMSFFFGAWTWAAAWEFVTSWASIATLVGIAAALVVIFSGNIIVRFAIPDLRKWAIVVAVIAFSITAIAGKFFNDGLQVKQDEWDNSLTKEAEDGAAIGAEAERSVRIEPPGSRVLANDTWNRDTWKKRKGN